MSTAQLETAATSAAAPTPARPYTGREYLDSLDDGREVWINGERVKSVPAHPAFRNSARMVARLYDALHDPALRELMTIPIDDGSGVRTHRFFQAPHDAAEQLAARDAIAHWARMTYGWMGRTPDYKAAWVGTLAGPCDAYAEYRPNAKRWYDVARMQVPFINHAIINPPIDRNVPAESSDVFVQVDKETDQGLVVSGAKVVATSAVLTQYTLVAHYAVAYKQKKYCPVFLVRTGAPGVKLICRASYEYNAAVTAAPFDAPLSSRLDENDSILVFDKVLVPWENVLMYSVESANAFVGQTGFFTRALLQACTRFAVKLEFIAGLFIKAVEITGTKDFRGVQAAVGEVIALHHAMWAFSEAMARSPAPWGDYVLPDEQAALAYRAQAGDAYSRVRNLVYKTVASALIYLPSSGRDLHNPALRPYLERYVRGSGGITSEQRIKTLKLLWDALSSEFASRHELYEINYSGSHEQVRVDPYVLGALSGRTDQMKALAEQCMAEYDLDGWTASDLINPARRD